MKMLAAKSVAEVVRARVMRRLLGSTILVGASVFGSAGTFAQQCAVTANSANCSGPGLLGGASLEFIEMAPDYAGGDFEVTIRDAEPLGSVRVYGGESTLVDEAMPLPGAGTINIEDSSFLISVLFPPSGEPTTSSGVVVYSQGDATVNLNGTSWVTSADEDGIVAVSTEGNASVKTGATTEVHATMGGFPFFNTDGIVAVAEVGNSEIDVQGSVRADFGNGIVGEAIEGDVTISTGPASSVSASDVGILASTSDGTYGPSGLGGGNILVDVEGMVDGSSVGVLGRSTNSDLISVSTGSASVVESDFGRGIAVFSSGERGASGNAEVNVNGMVQSSSNGIEVIATGNARVVVGEDAEITSQSGAGAVIYGDQSAGISVESGGQISGGTLSYGTRLGSVNGDVTAQIAEGATISSGADRALWIDAGDSFFGLRGVGGKVLVESDGTLNGGVRAQAFQGDIDISLGANSSTTFDDSFFFSSSIYNAAVYAASGGDSFFGGPVGGDVTVTADGLLRGAAGGIYATTTQGNVSVEVGETGSVTGERLSGVEAVATTGDTRVLVNGIVSGRTSGVGAGSELGNVAIEVNGTVSAENAIIAGVSKGQVSIETSAASVLTAQQYGIRATSNPGLPETSGPSDGLGIFHGDGEAIEPDHPFGVYDSTAGNIYIHANGQILAETGGIWASSENNNLTKVITGQELIN